ncbi:MAG: DNA/RNA nuclease SfsA [Ruminococcaceae bacterium]|nr:DNA/RNA nuclease SfsA [Oscillospiraceae bacterium]
MRYGQVIPGRFLSRPNRFIAHVEVAGEEIVCHVKNTGRCRELLVPGATVYLERGTNPKRKTGYDLIAVEKQGRLINMDSQAPNRVFGEWAQQWIPDLLTLRPEYRYGDARLDFCLQREGGLHLVEVKGVTLEEDGHCRFPDAPTERGIKHLEHLCRAVAEGHRATVFFVIQMADVRDFSPNDVTHPAFGEALRRAAADGVEVLAYCCRVTPETLELDAPVPVLL